jgi:hypothetical protein
MTKRQELPGCPALATGSTPVLAPPAAQGGLALDIPGRRRQDLSTDREARKILLRRRAGSSPGGERLQRADASGICRRADF